jgi:hypothetical protein
MWLQLTDLKNKTVNVINKEKPFHVNHYWFVKKIFATLAKELWQTALFNGPGRLIQDLSGVTWWIKDQLYNPARPYTKELLIYDDYLKRCKSIVYNFQFNYTK